MRRVARDAEAARELEQEPRDRGAYHNNNNDNSNNNKTKK